MANKTRRYYRAKRNRRILVSAVAIFIVVISVLAYVNSLHRQPVAQKDSSKYFTFSEFGAEGSQMGPTNLTIRILNLWFNFTPVGGDAHFVVIFTEGMTDSTQHTWDDIPNGTSTYSGEIMSGKGMVVVKADGGYAVKVRIRCTEADGWTTIIIPDDLVFLH